MLLLLFFNYQILPGRRTKRDDPDRPPTPTLQTELPQTPFKASQAQICKMTADWHFIFTRSLVAHLSDKLFHLFLSHGM